MKVLKDPLFWAIVAFVGALASFGPLILAIWGVLGGEVAPGITLNIGAPIFIPSVWTYDHGTIHSLNLSAREVPLKQFGFRGLLYLSIKY